MPLQDAYEVSTLDFIPNEDLGSLLVRIFGDHYSACSNKEILFRTEIYSDSHAMYVELSRMLYDTRATRCSLRFFVNHGLEIKPSDIIAPHLREVKTGAEMQLLDLVIEQRHTPLEYAVTRGDWPDIPKLLEWLSDCTALRSAAEGGLKTSNSTIIRLVYQGLIKMKTPSGSSIITEAGHTRLKGLVEEAQLHDERYSIFADVLYDDEALVADFGTGHGQDLRPLVYEAEGLDPIRTTFLVDVFLANDGEMGTQDVECYFTSLLTSAVDRPVMDDADLEQVIETGLGLVEADDETRQREISRRQAVRRARYLAHPNVEQEPA